MATAICPGSRPHTSEICRAERIWALDEGKLVIPVLATNDAKAIPLYLKPL